MPQRSIVVITYNLEKQGTDYKGMLPAAVVSHRQLHVMR